MKMDGVLRECLKTAAKLSRQALWRGQDVAWPVARSALFFWRFFAAKHWITTQQLMRPTKIASATDDGFMIGLPR
jgi:hypothetical protein